MEQSFTHLRACHQHCVAQNRRVLPEQAACAVANLVDEGRRAAAVVLPDVFAAAAGAHRRRCRQEGGRDLNDHYPKNGFIEEFHGNSWVAAKEKS